MAISDTATSEQIGDTAGVVWHLLNDNGSVPLTRLVKEVDAPRDLVMQSLGWLAREGKIVIEEEGRSKVISLR